MKNCEFYMQGWCCCGLTTVPKEIGYADILCSDECNNNCYYKQLLAEQAKNSELDATLKILKINHKLTISELNSEQAKNKKLVEALEKGMGVLMDANENTVEHPMYRDELDGLWVLFNQALNEVNK